MTIQSDLDGILQNLDDILAELREFRNTISVTPASDLAGKHQTWLRMYQAGQDVSYLAEKLDAPYQAQFAAQDDEPPTDEQVSYARLQKQLHDEGYAAPGPDDDDDDDGYDAPAYEDDSPAR